MPKFKALDILTESRNLLSTEEDVQSCTFTMSRFKKRFHNLFFENGFETEHVPTKCTPDGAHTASSYLMSGVLVCGSKAKRADGRTERGP